MPVHAQLSEACVKYFSLNSLHRQSHGVLGKWDHRRPEHWLTLIRVATWECKGPVMTVSVPADRLKDVEQREHRRREYRFKPNQIVTVRVLGLRPGPVLRASMLDVSGSGMRLRSKLPLPCGALVEIESDHLLSRGSVCRCEAEPSGQPGQDFYEIGILVSVTSPLAQ